MLGFLLRTDQLGVTILISDGVKQAKEARFIPAVKKLFQESENSSKPEYIFGHMFGGLGVLAGNLQMGLAAAILGNSLLLLDRYFLSATALLALKERNQSNLVCLNILTRAKANCIAYEWAPKKKPGRGRPSKKGEPIRLKELFESQEHLFKEDSLLLHGKEEQVRYYNINILWGQKLYQELCFDGEYEVFWSVPILR